MFDVSKVSKRYFDVRLENKVTIEVEPPKLKALMKITELSKSRNENAMKDLKEAIKMILSKNRSGYKVSDEIIINMDFDTTNDLLTAYFEWLYKTKNTPN